MISIRTLALPQLFPVAAAVVTLLAPVAVTAQSALIPANTEIVIRTSQPIDSRDVDLRQEYIAVLDEPLTVDGMVIAPKGADAVLQVVQASQVHGVKGRASLTLQLVGVVVNGTRIAVTTAGVKSEGGSQAARATKAGVGGAALGAVIGGFLGGGSGAAQGAAIGGGAAVGTVAIAGQRIRVPSETRLTFVITQDVLRPGA
jgi:hypothetical protein